MREVCRLVNRSQGIAADLTVVDAGSDDETFQILERLGRQLPLKFVRWEGGDNPAGSSALDLGYVLCDRPAVLLLHLTEPGRSARFLELVRSLCSGTSIRGAAREEVSGNA